MNFLITIIKQHPIDYFSTQAIILEQIPLPMRKPGSVGFPAVPQQLLLNQHLLCN
jgi:hypothetical protein